MANLNFPIFFANMSAGYLLINLEGFYSCIIMGVQALGLYGKHKIFEIPDKISGTGKTDVT